MENKASAALQQAYAAKNWVEVESLYTKLPAELQKSGDMRNALGVAYHFQGKLEPAKKLFLEVDVDFPNNPGVIKNLGMNAIARGDAAGAEKWYQQACELDRADADPAFQLGQMYFKHGDFAKAGQWLGIALERDPNHSNSQLVQMSMYIDVLPPERWAALLNMVTHPSGLSPYMTAIYQLRQLVVGWVTGAKTEDMQQYLAAISASAEYLDQHGHSTVGADVKASDATVRSVNGYKNYFKGLLSVQGEVPARDEALPVFYMVGDSHTLAPHHQTTMWQGQKHQLCSHLVTGLKLWHLMQPKANPQRSSFLARVQKIPTDAPLLISAGEIDTRLNEGIIEASEKLNQPLDVTMRNTFEGAMQVLSKVLVGRPNVVLNGIPAPHPDNMQKISFPESEWNAYGRLIQLANQIMAEYAAKAGFYMADVHSMTVNPETMVFNTDTPYNLDSRHLAPNALSTALENHLIKPTT